MGFEPTTWSGDHFLGLDAESSRLHFEEELVLFAAKNGWGGYAHVCQPPKTARSIISVSGSYES